MTLNKKPENQENDKLSQEAIERIKDFSLNKLTSEQQLLIEELIPNQELKRRYKSYGLCRECSQPKTRRDWCQSCNSKHFQQNFSNWTSGNSGIDEFIQKNQLKAVGADKLLEWIPYEQFKDVEYLAQGGFSKVYKAKWTNGLIVDWNTENGQWNRQINNLEVALKSLHKSHNVTIEFLQETMYHKLLDFGQVAQCYGISQEPKTKNYIMVMKYFPNGNLRQYLSNNKVNFWSELGNLLNTARGLNQIHQQGLAHRDLHIGNVLNNRPTCYITDLGLCRPANEKNKENVYGVLPYIAPEVLRREPHTPASDIYSFGMIMYEVFSKMSPYMVYDVEEKNYKEIPHDAYLAIKICQGLRPNLNEVETPQACKDLVEQCWDADSAKRPTASELEDILGDWFGEVFDEPQDAQSTEFYQQYKEIEKKKNNYELKSVPYQSNKTPHASCLLDFKNLPEPQNSKETNDEFYSNSSGTDFWGLSSNEKVERQTQIIQQQPFVFTSSSKK